MKTKQKKSKQKKSLLSMRVPLLLILSLVAGAGIFYCIQLARTSNPLTGVFHGKIVIAPKLTDRYDPLTNPNVLGDISNKRIEINLSNQRVYAFEGASILREFVVSTGKWGRTPTGDFTIQRKVRSQTMSGGNKALGTYYYLPNVQFVQFFGNAQIPWSKGFSFHSTYWHNNFGHPMSHGCINMTLADSEWLYNWAPMGTPVKIYGVTPSN